jgi:hypothetical protein
MSNFPKASVKYKRRRIMIAARETAAPQQPGEHPA